jgi:hypothetical protein
VCDDEAGAAMVWKKASSQHLIYVVGIIVYYKQTLKVRKLKK